MKFFMMTIMALSISTAAFAADLNETSVQTLIKAEETLVLEGDVLAGDSFKEIIINALLSPGTQITNECQESGDSDLARCTLYITHKEHGETALIYMVNLAGTKLVSPFVEIARGH
jgi:hypothetical protein